MNLRDKLKLMMLTEAKKTKEPIYCEYLEADGKQYIDLGKTVDPSKQDRTIITRIKWTEGHDDARQAMLTNTKGYFEKEAKTGLYSLGGGATSNIKASTTSFDKIEFHQSPSTNVVSLYINDKRGVTRELKSNPYDSDYLFALQYPTGEANFKCFCQMASFQMYDKDNNLALNLRPCLHPETLRPAMYDTVEKKYYYNQGTGEFKYKIGFTKLDFVRSDNHTFLDTRYKPNLKRTTFELDCAVSQPFGSTSGFFGSRENYSRETFNLFAMPSGAGAYRLRLDLLGKGEIYSEYIDTKGERLFVEGNKERITVNGRSYAGATSTDVFSSYPLYLFNFRDGANGARTEGVPLDLYSCKIATDGILVRDYIPVRRNDGTICLYDYINGDYDIAMNSLDYTLRRKLKGYLNGYQVGESLQGDGGPWIDSGFKPNPTTTKAIFQMYFTNVNLTPQGVFGSRGTGGVGPTSCNILANTGDDKNRIRLDWVGSYEETVTRGPIIKLGTAFNFVCHNNTIIINDVLYTGTRAKLNDYIEFPLYLFAVNNAGKPDSFPKSPQKMTYCHIFDNDKPARFFIPVRKDNFIGMLDVLTGKEYANQGQGDFIFNG